MQYTTTQDQFHPMRGHVAEGVTVKMNNGDVLRIASGMSGWCLVGSDGKEIKSGLSAAALTEFICQHGSRI